MFTKRLAQAFEEKGFQKMLKQTILVVSPNGGQSNMICESLEKTGYRVVVTGLGQSTVDMIHQLMPDLVLLEWRLPDLSSLALIRRIRADEWAADLPIIIHGMDMGDEDFLMGLEAGADFCLREPFHPEVFIARVRALLRRCHDFAPVV
jgi:two-component system phosphate regulon response regulator PhoB